MLGSRPLRRKGLNIMMTIILEIKRVSDFFNKLLIKDYAAALQKPTLNQLDNEKI